MNERRIAELRERYARSSLYRDWNELVHNASVDGWKPPTDRALIRWGKGILRYWD